MEQILTKGYELKTKNHKLSTNLDTNFLKVIAIIAMVLDHIGKAFFPDILIFQVIGRVAFPIFAYCIIVGVTHTSNFKKYITRLGLFAIVSQIPWVLAFNPTVDAFKENWMILNIFFTLFFSALLVYGMKEKSWIYIIASISAFALLPLDYGFDTALFLASLYLLRDKMLLSCILASIVLGCSLFINGDISVFGLSLGMQGFAILAIPLIYIKTNMNLKVNKYFFYAFYPAHLMIIFLVRYFLNIV